MLSNFSAISWLDKPVVSKRPLRISLTPLCNQKWGGNFKQFAWLCFNAQFDRELAIPWPRTQMHHALPPVVLSASIEDVLRKMRCRARNGHQATKQRRDSEDGTLCK